MIMITNSPGGPLGQHLFLAPVVHWAEFQQGAMGTTQASLVIAAVTIVMDLLLERMLKSMTGVVMKYLSQLGWLDQLWKFSGTAVPTMQVAIHIDFVNCHMEELVI